MRSTLNVQHSTPAELAKALRSAAAKIELGDIVPGADITVGNVRVQVATPQISDKRAWGLANGFEVGSRGRYSAELTEAYDAAVKADKAARAAERKAARAAKALVSA